MSSSGGQTPQFWVNFDVFGAPVPTPFYQMWCAIADPLHALTCQMSSRSVYFVALCWRKPPIFAVFWTSAFSVVANWQQSDKVEHGTQLQTFHIQRHQNRFCTPTPSWRNRAHKLWHSKTWRTNKQTDTHKNSTFLATPAAGEMILRFFILDAFHVFNVFLYIYNFFY